MKRFLLLLALSLMLIGCSGNPEDPIIYLNGDSEITVEVFSEYNDLGAYALYDSIQYDATATGEVNLNVVGTYEVTYSYSVDDLTAQDVTRTINVVDTTRPEIELVGTNEITLNVNVDSLEDQFLLSDNYDSAENLEIVYLQSAISDVLGTYTVELYVTDTNGNQSEIKTLTVSVVDTIPPQIELLTQNITIGTEDDFPLDLIEFTDNYDDTEDIEIICIGMDDLVIGENQVFVKAVDSSGNVSEELTVIINAIDDQAPTLAFSELDDFTHEQGVPFTNDYLVLYDNIDSFEDIELFVEGEVDINTLGEYEMIYYAVDKSGNTSATITKTVTVVPKEDLNYFERYMKDHTSLYDPVKFTNNYMYDALEKAYRGLVLNNEGEYELVYYFFLHNMLDGNHVLTKVEFVNREGENIVYELDDNIIDYVFEIPLEFVGDRTYFNVKTYPHAEYNTSEDYWLGTFSFNGAENLDIEYILTQELRQGNLK